MMLGPINFGSTRGRQEMWLLLHKLWVLIRWGDTTYRTEFFEKNIIAWAKERTAPPTQENKGKGKEKEK